MTNPNRHCYYIGSSKKDLKSLPSEVMEVFSFGIYQAQLGERHTKAKTFSGMGNAKVIEIRERGKGGTYRAVYTVEYEEAVYVLHVFQKKSTRGIATPQPDVDLIKQRLKDAKAHHKQNYGKKIK